MSIRVPEVARQKRLNDYSEINFECDVTMTNNGTGSGSLLLGLPFSAMGTTRLMGITSPRERASCRATLQAPMPSCSKGAAAYPVVTGDLIIVRGDTANLPQEQGWGLALSGP